MEKKEKPNASSSILSLVESVSSKIKTCTCGFKMNEARWAFCRSALVFTVGVMLTMQLQNVQINSKLIFRYLLIFNRKLALTEKNNETISYKTSSECTVAFNVEYNNKFGTTLSYEFLKNH
uniref:Uncharacterized protein n=1 Tax=Glossina palpalis gambiensis TaxID=67801 RepID=A0A1B0B4Z2_9MUSC